MRVPFLDLAASFREIQDEVEGAVLRVLRSGWYIGGAELEAFEDDFGRYCDAKYCVGVGNGLEALLLSLRALEIGPGDEVLVPSHTFVATWLAVSQCGATPVPVEPDDVTFNIDPARIAEAVTDRTRAIIPVHLYGQPADLDRVLQIAQHHGLRVLEDAAQAHGARYKGRRIGAHGDLVAWSFYPGKNLGAFGDGGAVTTDDEGLADRLRVLRNYGSRKRYVNEVAGYNSRLDPVQAAALGVKLRRLEEWNGRRSKIADYYRTELAGLDLRLPADADWTEPVWHLYCVRHPRRDWLRNTLAEAGIDTLIHYPIPPHRQSAYAALGIDEGALPVAERMAAELISLPIGPAMSDLQVERVVAALRGALRH